MTYKTKSALQNLATTAITLSGVMAAASITLSGEAAQALNVSFGTNDFTLTNGIGSNNASSGIAINTSSSPNGFGNVFTTNFLLLGANPSNSSIPTDSLRNNNSQAESISFTLTSADVAQPITMSFNWAFTGNSTGGFNDKDNFNILILKTDETDGAQLFERTVDPSDTILGYGSANNQSTTILANTLSAGNYQIVISLNENGSNNSSAAGFNNIILSTPPAPVPFGFSTNASLVVFGGVFYGFNKLRKNMAAKKSQA